MSFFKVIIITDKDAQTKFFWGPSVQVHGREAASFVKLFSCLGSLALLASVSFQPLRCSKVVCGGFKEQTWVNRLGVVTFAVNPRSQKAEAG